MKYLLINLILVSTAIVGCRTVRTQPISTHFENTGRSLLWTVQNNTDQNIVINAYNSGVNIYKHEDHEVDGEMVKAVGVVPGMSRSVFTKPLILTPGKSHRFTVQGYRALKPNETAVAGISLDAPGHSIRGSLRLKGADLQKTHP